MLKHVLEREAHWLQWKGYGCREFERESLEMLNAKAIPADVLEKNPTKEAPAKPKLAPHISSMLKILRDPQFKVSTAGSTTSSEDATAEMQTARCFKMCEANLDRLVEDDKPENGIEEEYKAKRNKVFMWQSRRLFSQQYLNVYAVKENHTKSDFMDFVKYIRPPPKSVSDEAAAQAGAATTVSESPPADTGEGGEGGEEEDEPMPAEMPEPETFSTEAAPAVEEKAAGDVKTEAAPAEAKEDVKEEEMKEEAKEELKEEAKEEEKEAPPPADSNEAAGADTTEKAPAEANAEEPPAKKAKKS